MKNSTKSDFARTPPQERTEYGICNTLRNSLENLKQAQAMGSLCDGCKKLLIDDIVFMNGKRYHRGCYDNHDCHLSPEDGCDCVGL